MPLEVIFLLMHITVDTVWGSKKAIIEDFDVSNEEGFSGKIALFMPKLFWGIDKD